MQVILISKSKRGLLDIMVVRNKINPNQAIPKKQSSDHKEYNLTLVEGKYLPSISTICIRENKNKSETENSSLQAWKVLWIFYVRIFGH